MFVSLFKALSFLFFFFFKQLAFSSVLRILSLIEVSGGEGCAVAYKISCKSGLEAGLDLQCGSVTPWHSDQAVCSTPVS